MDRLGRAAAVPQPAPCKAAFGRHAASALIRLWLAAPRYGIKFEAVPDEVVAEFAGDDLLQLLDLLVAEFDDPTALQIDQVIMMGARHFFIARAAVSEIVTGENVGLFKQPDGTIDRGDADPRIDRGGAPVDLLDIGWSAESDSTRAMTRRCSVIFSPLSRQSCSRREVIASRSGRSLPAAL
jgi:hypothetical protein